MMKLLRRYEEKGKNAVFLPQLPDLAAILPLIDWGRLGQACPP